jgi:hypothetical protein
MATFHFNLPQSLSAKDVFATSTNAVISFDPPGAFVPASITKADQEGSEMFSVSVQDLPKARDSHQEREETATLFLMKGDKTLAKIQLHEC